MRASHILAFSLLLAGAAAHPQFQQWDQENIYDQGVGTFISGQPIRATSSTTTPQPTTASPRMLACIQSCPATTEYNPICGSDNVNYFNPGRLNCAIQCGQNVRSVHLGICSTT